MGEEGSRFNQQLAMDESTLDTPWFANPSIFMHVPTDFINFVLDIHVQLLGVPLFKEVDDTSW